MSFGFSIIICKALEVLLSMSCKRNLASLLSPFSESLFPMWVFVAPIVATAAAASSALRMHLSCFCGVVFLSPETPFPEPVCLIVTFLAASICCCSPDNCRVRSPPSSMAEGDLDRCATMLEKPRLMSRATGFLLSGGNASTSVSATTSPKTSATSPLLPASPLLPLSKCLLPAFDMRKASARRFLTSSMSAASPPPSASVRALGGGEGDFGEKSSSKLGRTSPSSSS
mmetsp:Transcript_101028/g.290742  ORF Transcript_101028/g.290742 Transcript_101028/m.290742 type:complete len:228 (+) Transcript_101028:2079-2762(+)